VSRTSRQERVDSCAHSGKSRRGGSNVPQAPADPPPPRQAYEGHVDVLRVLLDHGVDLGRATKQGATPYSLAQKARRHECVRFLTDNGFEKVPGGRPEAETPL